MMRIGLHQALKADASLTGVGCSSAVWGDRPPRGPVFAKHKVAGVRVGYWKTRALWDRRVSLGIPN